jgi:hypothetical protein
MSNQNKNTVKQLAEKAAIPLAVITAVGSLALLHGNAKRVWHLEDSPNHPVQTSNPHN